MRGISALVVTLALAVAVSAGAPPAGASEPCGDPAPGGAMQCCDEAPGAFGCSIGDCAGMGAVLVVAEPDRGYASHGSVVPLAGVEPLIARASRAPDTAPPKPVV